MARGQLARETAAAQQAVFEQVDRDGDGQLGSLEDLAGASLIDYSYANATGNATSLVVSFDAPAGLVSCTGEPLEYSVRLSAGEAGDRACTVARCDYYCSDGITVKSVLKGAGWANNGQKSAGKIRCVEQTRSVKCSACMSGRR